MGNEALTRDFWGRHVEAELSSGLSQAEYCRRHGIGLSSWGYWRRKLAVDRIPEEGASGADELTNAHSEPLVLLTINST